MSDRRYDYSLISTLEDRSDAIRQSADILILVMEIASEMRTYARPYGPLLEHQDSDDYCACLSNRVIVALDNYFSHSTLTAAVAILHDQKQNWCINCQKTMIMWRCPQCSYTSKQRREGRHWCASCHKYS